MASARASPIALGGGEDSHALWTLTHPRYLAWVAPAALGLVVIVTLPLRADAPRTAISRSGQLGGADDLIEVPGTASGTNA